MGVIDIPSPSPLFKNLDCLVIEIVSSSTTLQGSELDLVDIHCADDMFDQEERANKIIRFIDLTRIKKLEFRPMNVISQLHLIKQILL
ncbi:unnamed protein product [Rotaria sp. Silwood2]|nr:unnamed protein product [Rotaria sp. Silwood2]CAF3418403.1 unnamed protein product [Rotaria sp. Silwood2]CAF4197916.1 unnamed protein product [Rotaria sp. Silwood2]